MGPYVPDKILRAVAAYEHRRNLHPSTSQTAKEFKAYYYHPMADKIIKELCRNCITCTQTRNKENRIYIRVEFTRKKCKRAILLYCFHTAGVLHIFVLYNLLGPGTSFYRKSKINIF